MAPTTLSEKGKAAVDELLELAREKGYVTSEDVAEALPSDDEDVFDIACARLVQADVEIRDDDEADVEDDPLATHRGRRSEPLDSTIGDSDDTVSLYLREIGSIPLLTGDDEKALSRHYELGRDAAEQLSDPEAVANMSPQARAELENQVHIGERCRSRMINANSRLVVHIAKKYTNNGVPFQDLIQEGNLGLIRAVEKFDWRRGFKFSTYATWWIRQAITRALADQARTIRVPVHMSEQISKVKAVKHRLEQELAREPKLEEIASELDITPERVERVLEIAQRPLSLEMPVGEEADSELGDFIPDDDTPAPTEYAGRRLLRDEIVDVLGSLSPREAEVLQLRYGLVDDTPHTLEEVGEKFGVTRERIRQIETRAIRRLRHPTRSKKLRDYLREG